MKQNVNFRQANLDYLFMNKPLLIKVIKEKNSTLGHVVEACRRSM